MLFFFFNDTATTEIYTLSLHDALPISRLRRTRVLVRPARRAARPSDRRAAVRRWRPRGVVLLRPVRLRPGLDRKSTRLNSSHANISYAVFCLKKKKKKQQYLSS